MSEEFHQEETEIIALGDTISRIIFLVQGQIEI
jgi:hypothetical protein